MQRGADQTGPERANIYAHAPAWLDRVALVPRDSARCRLWRRPLPVSLPANGWRAVGVEPSSEAAAYARRNRNEVYSSAWPIPALADKLVEAVTFINVLDHLPDPFEALREAARVLKPGGLLYVRVPNAPLHVWLRRWLAGVGGQWGTTLHLYGFSRGAVAFVFPRLGFTLITVCAAPSASGYPYRNAEALPAWRSRILSTMRQLHRAWYWFARLAGLDRLGWGLSLEVLARKPSALPGTHP